VRNIDFGQYRIAKKGKQPKQIASFKKSIVVFRNTLYATR
jgi:hypothetical protein